MNNYYNPNINQNINPNNNQNINPNNVKTNNIISIKSTPLIRNNVITSNDDNKIKNISASKRSKIEKFESIVSFPSRELSDKKRSLIKKKDLLNIFVIILTLLAAFGFHSVFIFIIKKYIQSNNFGPNIEFFTRLVYPVAIFFIIWLVISYFS